jgi:hypothetical protein
MPNPKAERRPFNLWAVVRRAVRLAERKRREKEKRK